MLNPVLHSTAFSLPIPESIHQQAEIESLRYFPYDEKVEQVYLSYLGYYIAQYYLQLCGYPVDDPAKHDSTFVEQALSDSAVVSLLGYGDMACFIVPSGQECLILPTVANVSLIGYLAIAFDDDLTEAKLMGFMPQTSQIEIGLHELQPLLALPKYLSQINSLASATVQLSRWWERSFESGWTLIAELCEARTRAPTLAFRSVQSVDGEHHDERACIPEEGIICQKNLSLGSDEGSCSLTLMMERFTTPIPSVNIAARLNPSLGQAYLPADVQLIATDESHKALSSICSRQSSPSIELRFVAEPGDRFSLKVVLQGLTITESFIV